MRLWYKTTQILLIHLCKMFSQINLHFIATSAESLHATECNTHTCTYLQYQISFEQFGSKLGLGIRFSLEWEHSTDRRGYHACLCTHKRHSKYVFTWPKFMPLRDCSQTLVRGAWCKQILTGNFFGAPFRPQKKKKIRAPILHENYRSTP